jgi:P27 family predicted phage terminase small subunit
VGKGGRPRKPTSLKVLEGSYRPDRAVANEPRPAVVELEPPDHLSGLALEEWKRTAPVLARLRLSTEADRAALEGYCESYATWRVMKADLEEHGYTFETEKGYQAQRPEVGIMNTALKQMRAFLTEFGMTPASRTKASALPELQADSDESFLFGESRGTGKER